MREVKKHKFRINISVIIVLFLSFILFSLIIVKAGEHLGFCKSMSWKEEVLLHDGSIIIVERFYHLGGHSTIASKERRALDETVSFRLPGSNKKIKWKTDFRVSEPEPNSLNLLVLDIVNGTPYIAAYPAGCVAYNKWNRPNPPYIFFRYNGKEWKKISLKEFPAILNNVNVIVGRPSAEQLSSFYTVEQVKKENRKINKEIYKTIILSPLKGEVCEKLIYYKGYWIGPGDSNRKRIDRIKE